MNTFAFSVSMPPSANAMFTSINVKGKQRRILSRDYRKWKKREQPHINECWHRAGSPAFVRGLAVTISLGLNYQSDIDNRIKPLLDILGESIPDFPNDRYIERLEVERVKEIKGARVLIVQLSDKPGEPV